VSVDTDKSHQVYKQWLEITRPADRHSHDGTRRPYWLLRPVRPERPAYDLPTNGKEPGPAAPAEAEERASSEPDAPSGAE
jgi:hypothetical protein